MASDLVIRALSLEDLDAAFDLSTAIGWNQRRNDWRMLLQLAPAGAFAAIVEARLIGTSIGIDYGGFGWIAMMLVDPAYRGRGVGRRLLEAAIDAVPSHLRIRLDATPLGRPLYQQYGFQDEAALSRHVRDQSDPEPVRTSQSLADNGSVRPLATSDLPLVVEQDRQTFGGTRAAVLEWALREAPDYAYVVPASDGSINYCLGRHGRQFDQIGPVVASDENIARTLLHAALVAASGRPVVVDAFDEYAWFSTALTRAGFVVQRPLVRMCRTARSDAHEAVVRESNAREFAILGPEFA